uniref:Macrophage migration inhibitory factor homolog n=1 Tax=Rhizophora mucronata TaxID=61149 RepID=A0A2P2J1T2_RHIMU
MRWVDILFRTSPALCYSKTSHLQLTGTTEDACPLHYYQRQPRCSGQGFHILRCHESCFSDHRQTPTCSSLYLSSSFSNL